MGLHYKRSAIESLIAMIMRYECLKEFKIEDITFNFSIYKNGRQGSGMSEIRKIEQSPVFKSKKEFCDYIEYLLKETPDYCELAINSLIKIKETTYHIPLIDFSFSDYTPLIEGKLKEFNEKFHGTINLYSTGRSFHGYHDILLDETTWHHEYLGELLLLNGAQNLSIARGINNRKRSSVEVQQIVDPRWVGHSLKQGYSSLRISHNTSAYIQLPKFEFKV